MIFELRFTNNFHFWEYNGANVILICLYIDTIIEELLQLHRAKKDSGEKDCKTFYTILGQKLKVSQQDILVSTSEI